MSHATETVSVSDQAVTLDGVEETRRQVIAWLRTPELDAAIADAQARSAAGESTVVTATAMRSVGLDRIILHLAGLG